MPGQKKREPRSGCPISHALDLIGDRWTLLVVRNLMLWNIHEFRELLRTCDGIASNILSDRLKSLRDSRLVDSIPHPTNRKKKLYYLTERGKSLLPLMVEIIIWGADTCPTEAPPETIEALKKRPEAFIRDTLTKLEAWESANVHAAFEFRR